MITGFEKQTKDLSPAEKDSARAIRHMLKEVEGTFVTNSEMDAVLKRMNLPGGPPRIRKMISWMILNKHINYVVANNRGYKITKDQEELDEYAKSMYERHKAMEARYLVALSQAQRAREASEKK